MTEPLRHPPSAMSPGDEPVVAASQDVATYVATITSELASMTRAAEFATLAYLLEMARIEAEHQLEALKAMKR